MHGHVRGKARGFGKEPVCPADYIGICGQRRIGAGEGKPALPFPHQQRVAWHGKGVEQALDLMITVRTDAHDVQIQVDLASGRKRELHHVLQDRGMVRNMARL